MSVTYYCPLLKGTITEGRCLDINYENIRMKKPDEIISIGTTFNYTLDEIREKCEICPNNPL
ncbi:Putative uncharacterized protein [Thermobacillus xylanilyticus]|jgi:hypothetical protein|uniref:4Fe4S-binding SPASM domain-containing protein n=1 Tax=Thermobacillus xylanilyticus TaxID=76633 RepID=A0ABM8V4G3_THEXY|nr:Putative uncharacterized protein [Thermobacillus xylanilyticus]